ncbi:MAG: tetratricopeptide (TPR) repeat protein, partial [Planctomycetota bacterium]
MKNSCVLRLSVLPVLIAACITPADELLRPVVPIPSEDIKPVDKPIPTVQDSEPEVEKPKPVVTNTQFAIKQAEALQSAGDRRGAIEAWHFVSEVELGQALPDPKLVGLGIANAAHVHVELHEYETALELYEKSIEWYRRGKRGESSVAALFSRMGHVHEDLGQFDLAEDFYLDSKAVNEEALEVLGQWGSRSRHHQVGRAMSQANLALLYVSWGKRELALELVENALAALRSVDSKNDQIPSLMMNQALWLMDRDDARAANPGGGDSA